MANLPSARKRIKQDERRRVRNRARKALLKTETKKLLDAVHDGDVSAAREQFRVVTRKLDQVAATAAIHRNTAARRKSRLARRLNAVAAASSA